MSRGSTSAYDRMRPRVDALQEAFYRLLDAADAYTDVIDALVEELDGHADPELIRRLRHQRSEAEALIAAVEGEPMAALLRIVDRVVMVRHTEQGRFV